jgi:deoxyribose-phosphate aldolase
MQRRKRRRMKKYTAKEVAATIDHAVLKPMQTEQDVIKNAQMCIKRGVKSMCVRPCDVALTAKQLKGSGIDVSVVIGFPHGSNRSETKALEAKLAIQDGAKELDMVMNIGKFLSGNHDYVKKDIEAVVAEAKKAGALVKVILETCYLSKEQVATACKIAEAAGADFVKTSTGFGDGPATPEVIDIMIKTVGKTMGVKASGGIRSWDTAVGYLNQGCTRLGVGSTEAVLDGAQADGKY